MDGTEQTQLHFKHDILLISQWKSSWRRKYAYELPLPEVTNKVVNAFSVQLVDAVHAEVEALLWMDTVSAADVDRSKRFPDSNLLEKSTSFNLEKSHASYYFAKYIYLLVAVLELVAFQNLHSMV